MTSRFMTDPHAMRDMAGRFEVHAQTVEDEARRMWASAQNISGAGWSGMAEATSLDTMTQMNQAFRNIVNMLHGVRDGLVRDANNYEQQEQASQQILTPAVRPDVTCPNDTAADPNSSASPSHHAGARQQRARPRTRIHQHGVDFRWQHRKLHHPFPFPARHQSPPTPPT